MNEKEELQQNNMISNLPLLFANGYPTSLLKISETQLERFVPFMVHCSLGFINQHGRIDCNEPEWWPSDLPFSIPLIKPKCFQQNWVEKLRSIVLICYHFHKSTFLLKFCNDLSAYEHARLRFINNSNSTTSLYDRLTNKLLVTFRNENMSYDQPQRMRKCLLPSKPKNGVQPIMVEPPPFDIYLCDNCDAELYSEEAMLEHEKICILEGEEEDNGAAEMNYSINLLDSMMTSQTGRTAAEENVIQCDSPIPIPTDPENPQHSQQQQQQQQHQSSPKTENLVAYKEKSERRRRGKRKEKKVKSNNIRTRSESPTAKKPLELKSSPNKTPCADSISSFLLNLGLNLREKDDDNNSKSMEDQEQQGQHYHPTTQQQQQQQEQLEQEKNIFNESMPKNIESNSNRKIPRRNRTTLHLLNRSASMPFSSPAGKLLLHTTKSFVNEEYCKDRLERMERFCQPLPLENGTGRSKLSEKRAANVNPHCTFKGPANQTNRMYVFPTRKYGRRRARRRLRHFNSTLLSQCRPISVRLKRLTDIGKDVAKDTAKDTDSNGNESLTNLNIKLTRDTSSSSSWKILPTHTLPDNDNSHQQVLEQVNEQNEGEDKPDNINTNIDTGPQNGPSDSVVPAAEIATNGYLSMTERVTTEIIVDTIDLCSSDEDEKGNNNAGRNCAVEATLKSSSSLHIHKINNHESRMTFVHNTFSRSCATGKTSLTLSGNASNSFAINSPVHGDAPHSHLAEVQRPEDTVPIGEQILRNISEIFGPNRIIGKDNAYNSHDYLHTTPSIPIQQPQQSSIVMRTRTTSPLIQQLPTLDGKDNCNNRSHQNKRKTDSQGMVSSKSTEDLLTQPFQHYYNSVIDSPLSSSKGRENSSFLSNGENIQCNEIGSDMQRGRRWKCSSVSVDSTIVQGGVATTTTVAAASTLTAGDTAAPSAAWFNKRRRMNANGHCDLVMRRSRGSIIRGLPPDYEHQRISPAVHSNGVIEIDLTS